MSTSDSSQWPNVLTEVPMSDWPTVTAINQRLPMRVLRSRYFLVQIYTEKNDVLRMSVNATALSGDDWEDDISWDVLQRLKREAGYGDLDAIEIYPADKDVVNIASMRHLWILPGPHPLAWRLVWRPVR